MNVLVFASRKGGSGKSTLAAHLAAHVARPSRPSILIDTDPQGSLSLWYDLRGQSDLTLRRGPRNLGETLRAAEQAGCAWAFIDTPPNKSAAVVEAIRHATLIVIPTRPSLFDLAAVQDTIEIARELRTPYACVINAAPARRNELDAAVVTEARSSLEESRVPVWSGQITHRADFALALRQCEGVKEYDAESPAAQETAHLWTAIDRSVRAINGAYKSARAMHRIAA